MKTKLHHPRERNRNVAAVIHEVPIQHNSWHETTASLAFDKQTKNCFVQTANPEMVFEWRAEAEKRMREAGRPGMSDDQVRDFCSRYMPAYRAYLPGLYDRVSTKQREGGVDAGGRVDAGRHGVPAPGEAGDAREGGLAKALVIEVGRDRNPIL